MQKIMIIALLPLFLLPGCKTFDGAKDSWFGPDKAKHFIVSAAISGAVSLGSNNERKESYTFAKAVGVSMSFGIGKEIYDSRQGGTGWSWKDILWDFLGSVSGFYLAESIR